jgi:hypothetical protein
MSYENQICELYFLLHRNNINEIGSRLTLLLQSLKAEFTLFRIENEQAASLSLLICAVKGGVLHQFSFNIPPKGVEMNELERLLSASKMRKGVNEERANYTDHSSYLKTLYCLIGHVRDIYFGHGERDLAYMMIYVWYKFYPVLAIYAFHQFVIGATYGCWNDIKYFCKFISRVSSNGIHDPLIDVAVSCANHQLLSNKLTNLSKWIPRENKIKWLFEKLVIDWFSHHDLLHKDCSFSHQKKLYRQMIVSSCKDHNITIKNIFQSISKGIITDSYNKSNNGCSYFHDNVFIGTYIKTAVSIIERYKKDNSIMFDFDSCSESIWLNHKWCQMVSSFFDNKCCCGIPIVDISADISNESLYHAIGFACLVAIKSGLFRILLVSNTPIWIEFTNSDSICSIVYKIWNFCKCRSGSQFLFSFHFLMNAFVKKTDSPSVKLFIFSQRFLFDWTQVVKSFGNKCSFVFWNIGETVVIKKDFYIDDHKEILLVSGCNTALFEKFCNDKMSITGSYDFLLSSLYLDRYKRLSDYFDSHIFSAIPSIVYGNSCTSSCNSSFS